MDSGAARGLCFTAWLKASETGGRGRNNQRHTNKTGEQDRVHVARLPMWWALIAYWHRAATVHFTTRLALHQYG